MIMKLLKLLIVATMLFGVKNANTMNSEQDSQLYLAHANKAQEALAQNKFDLAEIAIKRALNIARKYPNSIFTNHIQHLIDTYEQKKASQPQACPLKTQTTGKRTYEDPIFLNPEDNPLDTLTYDDYEFQGIKRTLLP